MEVRIGDKKLLFTCKRVIAVVVSLVALLAAVILSARDTHVAGINIRPLAVLITLIVPGLWTYIFAPSQNSPQHEELAKRAVGELSELMRSNQSVTDDLERINTSGNVEIDTKLQHLCTQLRRSRDQLAMIVVHWKTVSPESVEEYLVEQDKMQDVLEQMDKKEKNNE